MIKNAYVELRNGSKIIKIKLTNQGIKGGMLNYQGSTSFKPPRGKRTITKSKNYTTSLIVNLEDGTSVTVPGPDLKVGKGK